MTCRIHVTPFLMVAFLFTISQSAQGADPLHQQIDQLILAKNKGKPISERTTDPAFVRRIYLDLVGRIPTTDEARTFLNDKSPNNREKLIDELLKSEEHPRRMQELFHVMLMERLGEHDAWLDYLKRSFAKNKPWNQMAREMLSGNSEDADSKGAVYFLSKRLEKYGQNPTDYPGLARDIGRLFLGKDLRCAQCHNHLFIDEYKQRDFQGLFAFIQNITLDRGTDPGVVEKPTKDKLTFSSVFEGIEMQTGPRVPGLKEISIPSFKRGEEYLVPPDKKKRTPGKLKFSVLAQLGEQLPTKENEAFAKNAVNRMWFVMMGRGIVHPLDLHHKDNPPSHPKLLDVLTKEFIAHNYDLRWLIRELALSETYQRSTMLPEKQEKFEPTTFLTAHEKRMSAEQILRSVLVATQPRKNWDKLFKEKKSEFTQAFANPAREAEIDFNPSLRAVLFLLNDPTVLSWLEAKDGNLVDRLSKLKADEKVAEEAYLAVLSRLPTEDEVAEVKSYLQKNEKRRPIAVGHMVWALLASTEFCVNH